MADQFERNDGAQACACAAESAYGGYGLTRIKIRRQHVGNRAERCITKGSQSKENGDRVQICRKDSGDQKRYSNPTKDHHCLSGIAKRPSPVNEVAGDSAAKEIAEIGCDKRNPYGKYASAQLDAFGDQIYRKPICDK